MKNDNFKLGEGYYLMVFLQPRYVFESALRVT